jgi:hypothetical protein
VNISQLRLRSEKFGINIIIIIIIIIIITVTDKLQKYTDLKDDLTRIWQLKTPCIIPPVLSTKGAIPNKLHESLKLLNFRPDLFIYSNAESRNNTCRVVRKLLAEQ